MEIDKGGLRQLLLDDFHRCLEKPGRSPAFPQLPQARRLLTTETEGSGSIHLSKPIFLSKGWGPPPRTLAATKPAGRILELGTGTGIGTAWLLAGMDANSKLDSVDSDPAVLEIAKRHLGHDRRVTFHLADGAHFLINARTQYDLIFADAWAGKYNHLEEALALLRVGGIYLINDLLPQPNWPADHAPKVPALINDLESREQFEVTKLNWFSGLMIVVRTAM